MAIDATIVGRVAAELMEQLEQQHPDAEVVEAMVIVELGGITDDDGDEITATRWACSTDRHVIKLGLVADVAGYLATPGRLFDS